MDGKYNTMGEMSGNEYNILIGKHERGHLVDLRVEGR